MCPSVWREWSWFLRSISNPLNDAVFEELVGQPQLVRELWWSNAQKPCTPLFTSLGCLNGNELTLADRIACRDHGF